MKTFQKILLTGSLLAFATALAAPPAWWAARGVTNNNTATDFAVANIGQVKNIATQAAAEMNAVLPGGADTAINNLIASWQAAPGQGVTRNDYAAINQGQLKSIALLFYNRLNVVGYQGPPLTGGQTHPWTDVTTDDASFAAANIGQVKFLFSFDFQLVTFGLDTDHDGIPDAWEIYYGLNPNSAADANALAADGSNQTNLFEYQNGRNPKNIADDQAFTPGANDVVLLTPSGRYYDVNTSTWVIAVVPSP